MEDFKPWGMEEKQFLMLMHFSQLAGMVIPGAGLVLPIVMWATNKDKSIEVDRHGKVIFNWMISGFIYTICSIILMLVIVGFFAFFALMLLNLIWIIMGGVKANEGVVWHYPLSIRFFYVE